MAEVGIDISDQTPRFLTPDSVQPKPKRKRAGRHVPTVSADFTPTAVCSCLGPP
jgi:hypothetical protein